MASKTTQKPRQNDPRVSHQPEGNRTMRSASDDLSIISAALAEACSFRRCSAPMNPARRRSGRRLPPQSAAYCDAGCAAQVAPAYGERPETAVTRTRWALGSLRISRYTVSTPPAPDQVAASRAA